MTSPIPERGLSYVAGNYAGGHCVCIIGYDDSAQCWIAKNSWGPAGEKAASSKSATASVASTPTCWRSTRSRRRKSRLAATSRNTPALADIRKQACSRVGRNRQPKSPERHDFINGANFGNKVARARPPSMGLVSPGQRPIVPRIDRYGRRSPSQRPVVSRRPKFRQQGYASHTAAFGPALAFGNGRVFLAWVGTDGARSLNVMSSTNGTQWGNKVALAESSDSQIALCWGEQSALFDLAGQRRRQQPQSASVERRITWSNKVHWVRPATAPPPWCRAAHNWCWAGPAVGEMLR